MFRIDGSSDLEEVVLEHLEGYRGPGRIEPVLSASRGGR
jgi:hypothetical protein